MKIFYFLLGTVFFGQLYILKVTGQPYPQSDIIKEIKWENEVLKLKKGSGDNWPIAWVNDTLQITSYGDGDGFDGMNRDLSLGIAYITGDPPGHKGIDLQSNIDTPMGGGPSGIKASGMIMVDEILYVFVRNYKPGNSDDYTNSRLAWSKDLGKTFHWADWHFPETFGCPAFVQFGMNYRNAMDNYVYIVSQDNDNAYEFSEGIVLARVPEKKVADRSLYEFYAGKKKNGKPLWTPEIDKRKSIFNNPEGIQRISVSYNPVLERFFLTTSFNPGNKDVTHTGALGIFEAKFPWGPWKTVYYNPEWSGECRTYHHRFPVKWISGNGREMWLLFSGLDCGYYDFCLKKARLYTE